MSGGLLKKRLEVAYYFGADVVPDFRKYFKNVAMGNYRRGAVGEAYANGDLGIHLHFGPAGDPNGSSPTYEWCLLLQRPTDAVDLKELVARVRFLKVEGAELGLESDEWEPAVLIEIGEFSENPERVPLPILASSVRLKPLHHCLSFWMHASNSPATPLSELVSTAIDRKLRPLFDFGRDGAADIGLGQTKREMIEAGAEVVDNVSDDQGEVQRRISEWLNADGVGALRVDLFADSIRLSTRPPLNFRGKSLQVLVCPLELQQVARRNHALTSP